MKTVLFIFPGAPLAFAVLFAVAVAFGWVTT